MVFGWPHSASTSSRAAGARFRTGHFSFLASPSPARPWLTFIWFWLIVTSPRSPMRGIMHWMAGLTLFWVLIAVLWMPWIDYGKTYRPLSASLAAGSPGQAATVSQMPICPIRILASLDYFDQHPDRGSRSSDNSSKTCCNWLLVLGQANATPDAIYARRLAQDLGRASAREIGATATSSAFITVWAKQKPPTRYPKSPVNSPE